MLFELLLMSAARLVTAQSSTSQLASPASTASQTSPYPTASIFFPGSLHGNLAKELGASIISANANQTEYAIGCLAATAIASAANNASISAEPSGECNIATSLTVTAGESTLIYTYLPSQSESNIMPGTSTVLPGPSDANADATTISCLLLGGGPTHSATQAVCTGRSSIAGLGNVGSTTTLASTQIDYATLTVTAGAVESAGQESDGETGTGSSSAGAAPTVTAARNGALGVVLMAGLGGVLL